jgi:hypothetical protein
VVAFESNKRNTNADYISNEKHIYKPLKSKKRTVCTILCELEWLAKNAFSARQNAFLILLQNLFID